MKEYVIELTHRGWGQIFYGSQSSARVLGSRLCFALDNAARYKTVAEAKVFLERLVNFKPIIRVVEDGVLTNEVVAG